jgi:hypothetical protein
VFGGVAEGIPAGVAGGFRSSAGKVVASLLPLSVIRQSFLVIFKGPSSFSRLVRCVILKQGGLGGLNPQHYPRKCGEVSAPFD